jgi:tRNA(Ile)-lysidine synthase
MTPNFNIPAHQKTIAVALSGGPDSMALAHMMCEWASDNDAHVHLLSVNHNLRAEAESELDHVAKWVADFPNATHHILSWDFDEKPNTAVMERARNARYDLMADYCGKNDIDILAIAHHADDNLETFLFRLAKGSGLDGLSCMREWVGYKNIKLYRPLLAHAKNELVNYCKNNNLKYLRDPSNENENYARPRLRKALASEGLDIARFAKTLNRIQRGQDALDWMTNYAIEEISSSRVKQSEVEGSHTYMNDQDPSAPLRSAQDDGINLDFEKLNRYPLDIRIRAIQKIINEIGHAAHEYPPKLERVEQIIATIRPAKSATLYGCILSLSKDGKTLEIKAS